jgi:hypothetical protein
LGEVVVAMLSTPTALQVWAVSAAEETGEQVSALVVPGPTEQVAAGAAVVQAAAQAVTVL